MCFAQALGLKSGRNHTVAADLQSALSPREHQTLDVGLKTKRLDVPLVETSQDGHSKNLEVFVGSEFLFSAVDCCCENLVVIMDRHKRGATTTQLAHRRGNGLRHIEKLEIDKCLLASRSQPVEQLEITPGHEDLQTEFVEEHAVAELLDQLLRLVNARNIERENQAFAWRNRFCGQMGPFSGHHFPERVALRDQRETSPANMKRRRYFMRCASR